MGTVLPCNIAIYESQGKMVVATLKTSPLAQIANNPEISEVAKEIEARPESVLKNI